MHTLNTKASHPQQDATLTESRKGRYSHRPSSIFTCTTYHSPLTLTHTSYPTQTTLPFSHNTLNPRPLPHTYKTTFTHWNSGYKQTKGLTHQIHTYTHHTLVPRIHNTTHCHSSQHTHSLHQHAHYTWSDLRQRHDVQATHRQHKH